jgi:integrase
VDQAAWTAAQIADDPFEPGGVAAAWAPSTRQVVANGYGLWLTWLAARGSLDAQQSPAERVSKDRVALYAETLAARQSPFSVQARVQQLGDALRAMAPDRDWGWILRAASRLRSRAVPVKDKRSRMQSPAALVDLGETLMSGAEGTTTAAAMDFRDGLIIAFLALRPIRARNLTAMSLDRHLVSHGGSWWVRFTAAETKGKQSLEFRFPVSLVPYLERYLEHWRPLLLTIAGRKPAAATSALWISSIGTPMVYASIGHQVRQRTKAAFGRSLSPHLFRDCAATAIAIADPEHVRDILTILGHATIATSQKHYNQTRGLEASRRYQDTIKGLRAGKSGRGDLGQVGSHG